MSEIQRLEVALIRLAEWEKKCLEKPMDDLRTCLAVLNSTSINGVEMFNDLSKIKFVDFNLK